MKLDQLATYLPAVLAIAFLAALVYCTGKFAYADGDWLQALTVSDIFATAWKALPFSALGLMTGMFIDTKPIPKVLSDEEVRAAAASWPLRRSLMSLLLTVGATSVFIGSLVLVVSASEFIPPDRAHLMSLWAILFCASVVVLMLRLRSSIDFNIGRIILWGTLVFSLSYSNGFASGGAAAMTPRTDQIRFRDGTEVCGSVLYAGERGVIYMNATGRETSLQPWDLIDRVSSDWPSCRSS